MADEKSCEGEVSTLECMKCGYREVFTERQFKVTDGLSCDVCKGPTRPVLTRPGEEIRNRRMKKQKNDRSGKGLSVKVDIDVSEALKGLKAVQREAKKTARALREVEERTGIKDLSNDEIFKELSARGWEIDEASFYAGGEEPMMRHIEMNKNNEKQEE